MALAAPLGMRPVVAHCHAGLGKLYRRTERREQALKYLATATTMYREMGMTYWLETAGAELQYSINPRRPNPRSPRSPGQNSNGQSDRSSLG
jgi:hypothetical protein